MAAETSAARGRACIVIAVDDSEPAGFAVEAGAKLAMAVNATVVLVHVIQPVTPFGDEDMPLAVGYHDVSLSRGQEILETAMSRLPANLEREVVLLEGAAAVEIAALARRRQADYIVIGTHGRGRIGQMLMGSVASGVARRASCPVLTVAHGVGAAETCAPVAVG